MDPARSEPRMVHILPSSERTPESQLPVPFPSSLPPNSWIDQPTTQAGNVRTRVFVACQTCRTRKIKCDGIKPVCTNCIKKEYAPGPDYQHLLAAHERYKLQNGICLYDQLPKRRGPDRLPGARVRRKSRQGDSGYERSLRHRALVDSSEGREYADSVNVSIDKRSAENTYLVSQPNVNSNMRMSDPLRPYGNSFPLDSSSTAAATSLPYSEHSHGYPPRDLSRISPPDSTSSSDCIRSPGRQHTSNPDRPTGSISTNDTSIPTGYRPIQPASENFVPQVSRIARGRQGSQSHARPAAPHDSQAGSLYQATNPYHEYMPSAGAYIQSLEESESEEQSRRSPGGAALSLPIVPGIEYVQKTWFDSLLVIYASFEAPIDSRQLYTNGSLAFSSDVRHNAQTTIATDLRLLFARSSHWFSFIHLPSFWTNFYSPQERASGSLQPGLLLSALALASLFRGSEIEGKIWARERANRLRAEAEAAVESSLASGWIDLGLAQAAWLLAMYEICPHPYHTLQKVHSAITRLDNIVRLLRCSSIDAGNPMATRFDKTAIPLVLDVQPRVRLYDGSSIRSSPTSPYSLAGSAYPLKIDTKLSNNSIEVTVPSHSPVTMHQVHGLHETRPCACTELSLGTDTSDWKRHVPLWQHTPRWPVQYGPGEIRREEVRRIVWSSIHLMSSFAGYAAALGTNGQLEDYWTASAENLVLLFPGESVHQQTHNVKDTVWAIYTQAQLLLLACLRFRESRNSAISETKLCTREDEQLLYTGPNLPRFQKGPGSNTDLAAFAMKAWLQTEEMEAALSKHSCGLERSFLFVGREYLSSIRRVISQDFSRYIPFPNSGTNSRFNRLHADDWLIHQSAIAQRMMSGLHHVTGVKLDVLAYRPFFIWWFMIQVVRLLNLWSCDNSMVGAVELAFAFLPVIDYLTALWPCHNQRSKYLVIRERLDDACRQCGLPLPPPSNFTIDTSYNSKNII